MPKYKFVASSVYCDYMQTERAGMRRIFFWVSGKWNRFSLGHRVATDLLPQFHCNFYGESVYNAFKTCEKCEKSGRVLLHWLCSDKLTVISDTASHVLILRMVIHTFEESCWDASCLWSLYASFFLTLFISVECLYCCFVKRDWTGRDCRRHNWESFSADIWTII